MTEVTSIRTHFIRRKFVNLLKRYLSSFVNDEDAVEAMEWMAIVAVAAILIVIAVKCGNKLLSKMKNIASNI